MIALQLSTLIKYLHRAIFKIKVSCVPQKPLIEEITNLRIRITLYYLRCMKKYSKDESLSLPLKNVSATILAHEYRLVDIIATSRYYLLLLARYLHANARRAGKMGECSSRMKMIEFTLTPILFTAYFHAIVATRACATSEYY